MDLQEKFFTPKLTGERFNNHTIPVDILEGFAAYKDLLFELAKNIFLKEHDRKRVPNGFLEGITLDIESVSEGSSVANFVLGLSMGTSSIVGPFELSHTYLTKSKEKIENVVSAVERGENISNLVESKYLPYFNKLGKNLRNDEVMYLGSNGIYSDVKINKVVRERLSNIVEPKTNGEKEISLYAAVPSIDKSNNTFLLEIEGEKSTNLSTDVEYFEIIFEAFKDYENGGLLFIKGMGIYNNSHKLIDISSIEKIYLLDQLDVPYRLRILSNMKDGWFDNEGLAPDKQGLEKFGKLFEVYFNHNLPTPAIFPTLEGGIQLEWTITTFEVSLEVNLTTLKSEFLSVNTSDGNSLEHEFDLENPQDWNKFNIFFTNNILK